MERLFIDVREPEEYVRGHVDGAINLPPASLMAGALELKDVSKDTELVLYCVSGSRSRASMNYLLQLGYTNLVNGVNQDHVKAKYNL
jgi:phage shock protein E